MSMLRIGAFMLAALLVLPCFLTPSVSAGVSPEYRVKSEAQAKREKEKLRKKADAERAKAYEPDDNPASHKKPLEILIHREGTQ